MKYLNKSFTIACANGKCTDRQWDFAMMKMEDFIDKYGKEAHEYHTSSSPNVVGT